MVPSACASTLPSSRKQVRRQYAEIPFAGAFLFGAVLGTALLTLIRTPMVWVGALAVIAVGSVSYGALYGLAFGSARMLRVMTPWLKGSQGTVVVESLLITSRRQHVIGAGVALSILVLSALAWLA